MNKINNNFAIFPRFFGCWLGTFLRGCFYNKKTQKTGHKKTSFFRVVGRDFCTFLTLPPLKMYGKKTVVRSGRD